MLQISEVNTKKEFYDMKKYWDLVLNKSVENNIFLTWEKMAPSVNQLEEANALKILCATEGNELVGIAPFRISRRGLKGLLGYGVIEPLTNGETDYTGIILSEQEDQCLYRFLTHLFSQRDWDFIYLPDLAEASQTLEIMKKAKDIPKFKLKKGIICPYIALPDTKEKLLARLSTKFKRNLRYSLNKLEKEHGKVELKHYYELGSFEETMEVFFRLHQERWESKGKPGRFANQKSRDITLQTAKYFAEKGWLRMYFLTVNDKPVAVELNLTYQKKMYCHLKGFDPTYFKYSVGHLLTSKILEECIEGGFSEYDFMQGEEAYKFDWTTKYRQSSNLKWVNNKLSSNIVDLCLELIHRTKLDIILIRVSRLLNYPLL
jgi:CelD/BcsL family acetyltransferase involved in cellulose biosynthesis